MQNENEQGEGGRSVWVRAGYERERQGGESGEKEEKLALFFFTSRLRPC